jgi:hypothetical protein
VNPPIESRCATDGDNKNLASDTKADASA